jgi:hypothetical protein
MPGMTLRSIASATSTAPTIAFAIQNSSPVEIEIPLTNVE